MDAALDRKIDGLAGLASGSWTGVRQWLSERIAEGWQARGPCPGLGAALTAFGIPEGVLVAFAAQNRLDDNEVVLPIYSNSGRAISMRASATALMDSVELSSTG